MSEHEDVARLRRLLAARDGGAVSPELLAWCRREVLPAVYAAAAAADAHGAPTPAGRARVRLSAEVDRWMRVRGLAQRDLSARRRTLSRALKGANVTLDSIAELADALGCELLVQFRARVAPHMAPNPQYVAPHSSAEQETGRIIEGEEIPR